ncbi:hypothetical protein ACA910_007746 [Epithemia clementina (nom. ined.)]
MISDTDSSSHSMPSVPGDSSSFPEGKLAALSLVASTAAVAEEAEMEVDLLPDPASTDASDELNTDPEDRSESSASSKRSKDASSDHPRRGGCHGRTSRNNSYCKRFPCYKGSQFCKLHYQQHVLAETTQNVPDEDSPPSTQLSSSPVPSEGEKKQGSFQDKRFSGSEGEIRCKATTTRGRECAYVAVRGGKYCYLHADYDNNPPPRRGGGAFSKKTSTASVADSLVNTGKKGGSEIQPTLSFSSESVGSLAGHLAQETVAVKPKASCERTKRRGSSAKIARKHMDSPFPLLSMISTDQWAKKRVKISVGPLSDRVGTVEKWSNGWVSVRVDGVGLHNRRSFELYLLQDDRDQTEENKTRVSPSCLTKADDEPGDVSRTTPSTSVLASETPSSIKPIRHALKPFVKVPVTPYSTQEQTEWPITPAASSDAPFVPHVTPNSPRRAMCASTACKNENDMGEGIFFSDTSGQPELALHLRLGALQQRTTAFSAQSSGNASTD